MKRCLIVGEELILQLIKRYDGVGEPLTSDEREILLFALYDESENNKGVVTRTKHRGVKP